MRPVRRRAVTLELGPRSVPWALWLATALLACAPQGSGEPARPAATSAQIAEAPARTLPPELAGVLEPHHPFDPAAAEASAVWLLTRYEPGTYPCRVGLDGSLEMLLRDRFTILGVLRGAGAAAAVDLDLHALRGPNYPRAYAEGRRYLLFIRPGPKGQAFLADPDGGGGSGDRLGADDVLAVIDLDASAAEVAAEAVVASRSGEAAGHRWTPESWAAARRAAAIDPAVQRELAAFLQAEVLRPRAALAELRAWLGAPDSQRLGRDGARDDQYILALPAYEAAAEGGIYGDLRLRFDARLELRAASLTYLRWRVSPAARSSSALTPAEHAALGLPAFALEFAADAR